MWKIIKSFFVQPIKVDDIVNICYVDKKGNITNRLIRVIETHENYFHCWCFMRDHFRNFSRSGIKSAKHLDFKKLRRISRKLGITA